MSSSYPPYGGTQARPCQRCGVALPPNEVYCGNCGYSNTPSQGGNPANASWGGMQQAAYGSGQGQYSNAQWGQGQPAQQMGRGNYAPPQQMGSGNYGSPPQQMGSGSYGPPGNYYGSASQGAYGAMPRRDGYPPSRPGNLNAANPLRQKQAPQRLSPLRILLLVLCLLLLVGGGFAMYKVFSPSTANTNVNQDAVPINQLPSGTPIFSDNFADNGNGWNTQSDTGKYAISVGANVMTLEDDNHKLLWELVPGNKTFSNFKLYVDAMLIKGDQNNGYGIYIRGASNQNSALATYYRFEIYGDGSYAVFKGNVDGAGNTTDTKLVDYSTDPIILPVNLTNPKPNHILVSAIGSTLIFTVNGTMLKTITDTSYTSGSIALFVSNLPESKTGAQASFAHLNIYPAS
jgi:hypothetical protein